MVTTRASCFSMLDSKERKLGDEIDGKELFVGSLLYFKIFYPGSSVFLPQQKSFYNYNTNLILGFHLDGA